MPQLFSLSTLTGLAVGGAALGLYLGKSAISEIDPAYFSSPFSESKFFADLVPNPPSGEGAPLQLQTASLPTDYGTGCINCRTVTADYFPVTEIRIPAYSSPYDYETAEFEPEEFDEAEEIARRAARETVERYAHYTVSEDSPVTLASASADAPEEATEESAPDCAVESQCAGEPTPGI